MAKDFDTLEYRYTPGERQFLLYEYLRENTCKGHVNIPTQLSRETAIGCAGAPEKLRIVTAPVERGHHGLVQSVTAWCFRMDSPFIMTVWEL